MARKLLSLVALPIVLSGCAIRFPSFPSFPSPQEPEKLSFVPINFMLPRGYGGATALRFEPQFKVIRKDNTSELFRRDAAVSADSIKITNQSFLADRRGRFEDPWVDYRPYEEIGVEYELRCLSQEQEKATLLSCGLTNRRVFNNAGISFKSRLDAQAFSTEELSHYLKSSASVGHTFEIDSPYNSDSTLANFHRLLKHVPSPGDGADRVTGKIYKSSYTMLYQDRELNLTIQVFPYRNGSRAVVTTMVPGTWSGANTIDFSRSIEAVKERIKSIVEA